MMRNPPSHPPAPHSLRELGVVEGGLQDASREHWGHRRTLQLGVTLPCTHPRHHTAPGSCPIPDPPRTRPRGRSGVGSAYPSGSCWAGSRHSVPGEAAATCKEGQQSWGAEHPGRWKCTAGEQGGTPGIPVPFCLHPRGASRHGSRGHWRHHAGPLHVPPGQGDTHADLSTSCRIFFTESLMPKAMLLRMFLK